MTLLPPQDMRRITLQDAVTLIHNVRAGATDPRVGFEDCLETVDSLCSHMDKRIQVPTSALESALWSCNLMDEFGAFWDAKGRSFDDFLKRAFPGERFDRRYNMLIVKDTK